MRLQTLLSSLGQGGPMHLASIRPWVLYHFRYIDQHSHTETGHKWLAAVVQLVLSDLRSLFSLAALSNCSTKSLLCDWYTWQGGEVERWEVGNKHQPTQLGVIYYCIEVQQIQGVALLPPPTTHLYSPLQAFNWLTDIVSQHHQLNICTLRTGYPVQYTKCMCVCMCICVCIYRDAM